MNRCETCRHRGDDPLETGYWDEEKDEYVERHTYYECKRVAHGNADYGKENHKPGEKALAVDGSGYHAKLVVENDFGCVLWEPKSAAAGDMGREK